jgi:hypothetical protein
MTAASTLLLLLTLLAPSPWPLSSSSGLVVADGFSLFKKQAVPDPAQVAAEEQTIARLKALKKTSSSSSSSARENTDTNSDNSKGDNDDNSDAAVKKLRVSKGKAKGIKGLLNVVVAGSSSSPPQPTESTSNNSNPASDARSTHPTNSDPVADPAPNQKTTGHEDDIIHEHDHADNDAYDDIVWYDGPHRDDEDEHGDDDHHDDDDHHEDDHHHEDEHFGEDHYDDEGESTGSSESLENTSDNMSSSISNNPQQQVLNGDSNNITDDTSATPTGHDHDHDHAIGQGVTMVYHHSGAEVLVGPISPVEFCLRLKHECESTCREFRSQVLHVSTSCEYGSVAELLLWGKCCQVGQVNRKTSSYSSPPAHMPRQPQQPIAAQASLSSEQQGQQQGNSIERQEELAQEHLQLQQKRHAAQQERKRERILQ